MATSTQDAHGESERPRRFSADGLKKLRARLTLSAAELGHLLNVSGQTVYNWERKLTTPDRAKLEMLAAVRGMGKRKVQAMLQKH